MKIYSVAVGVFNPLKKASRDATKFISKLEGLYGVHVVPDGRTLIFFKTLNDAKRARNRMTAEGIKSGNNICRFNVAADGVPEFEGVE